MVSKLVKGDVVIHRRTNKCWRVVEPLRVEPGAIIGNIRFEAVGATASMVCTEDNAYEVFLLPLKPEQNTDTDTVGRLPEGRSTQIYPPVSRGGIHHW